jgi:hypothetical protein
MNRLAPPILSAALAVCTLTTAAAAQEPSPPVLPASFSLPAVGLEVVAPLPDQAAAARPRRPEALLPLYLSFGALQVLDVHSTIGALDRGAVEVNPLMRPFAGNAGLVAVKAAGTVGVLYTTEHLWKKNPTAAVLFMVAANSALAFVVQNNYRMGR